MNFDFSGQVAVITGAGGGLGRCHALALSRRGVKVVVNDLGSSADGSGQSSDAALAVVEEIEKEGGEAYADGSNITVFDEVQEMAQKVLSKWGRMDILVNNAGILRDKTFAKMGIDDFRSVVEVHLMGSVNCTKAFWESMREQTYGRIVMVTSSSGLYGNFGQSNYGAAKMALVGLMKTLEKEGAKYNIHVNALAPVAATRMTEGLMEEDILKQINPAAVSPAVLFLTSPEAPNGVIMAAGAGSYARVRICESEGVWLAEEERTPEAISSHWQEISQQQGQVDIVTGADQTIKFAQQAETGGK